MPTLLDSLTKQLQRDEGLRLKVYADTVGKLTVGYGRNLTDVGIIPDEADYLLENDIRHVQLQIENSLPWSQGLDDARLGVLLNLCFNIGLAGLLQFRQTLALVESGNYTEAAIEMGKSKWAEQVGARAQRLMKQMETGVWM